MYRGWDVHSYTVDMRNLFHDNNTAMTWTEFAPVAAEIVAHYGNSAASVMKKMRSRLGADGTYRDPELNQLSILDLATDTWKLTKRVNDESIYKCFGETIEEMGNTCIQGDSHRLLSLFVGIRDSL